MRTAMKVCGSRICTDPCDSYWLVGIFSSIILVPDFLEQHFRILFSYSDVVISIMNGLINIVTEKVSWNLKAQESISEFRQLGRSLTVTCDVLTSTILMPTTSLASDYLIMLRLVFVNKAPERILLINFQWTPKNAVTQLKLKM